MTHTVTAALPAPTPALPAAVAERLERIRPHAEGLAPSALTAFIDEAFRNFEGVSTDIIVRYLSTPAA